MKVTFQRTENSVFQWLMNGLHRVAENVVIVLNLLCCCYAVVLFCLFIAWHFYT